MERVVQFVNERFKSSRNSKEVQGQKEELIASLHDKIYDAMSTGKSEDVAFADAVASLDDLDELTQMLDGNHKTLYVNRLSLHYGLIVFSVIALEILIGGLLYLIGPMAGKSADAMLAMKVSLACALFAVALTPVIYAIIYFKDPYKVQKTEFNLRKSLTVALIGWLAISLLLVIVNLAVISTTTEKVVWFWWPMLGISNWPVSLILYNSLYKNKRYEASAS